MDSDACDAVFVPSIANVGRRRGFCTKFQALPDLVANTFADQRIEVLSCLLNEVDEHKSMKDALIELATQRYTGPREAKRAWKAAARAQEQAERAATLRQTRALSQLEAARAAARRPEDAPLAILLAAHPYLAHDAFMGGALTDLLESMNAVVLFADEADRERSLQASFDFSDTLPWIVNREIIGAITQLHHRVDGIVLVSAFPCGPDSMTDDAIVRCIQGKPVLNLTIDAQSLCLAGRRRELHRHPALPEERGWAAPRDEKRDAVNPRTTDGDREVRARVVVGTRRGPSSCCPPCRRSPRQRERHARTRVAFFRYSYYDIAFKFFVEHVLEADFVALPKPTKRTIELGSRHSSDMVCAPFKHILGDYIEALELGADVLVQFAGPCRLGYYGELQQSIMRDLGYEFDMLNFAMLTGKPLTEYISVCKKKVNPDLSVPHGVRNMLAVFKMIEHLDEVNDFYLANAGFEAEPGSFERAREAYFADMRAATNEREIAEAQRKGLDALRALPQHRPARPLRVGIVGEYFTAADPASNLDLERKFLDMGVELHRALNMTNRNLRYNEKNLRAGISEYVQYDMGPTSQHEHRGRAQVRAGRVRRHRALKSSAARPEVDCMPVLQRISRDTGVPVLYLSYDSQTSDTGLDTRLEAFYDMIAMKKEKTAR